MHQLTENCKVVQAAKPQTKNNGAAAVNEVDAQYFNHVTYLLAVGALDTTVDMKIQESDTSGSGFADITGAAITQLGATDDNKTVAIEVSLVGPRKRYTKPVITVGSGTTGADLACLAILTRGERSPANAAAAGLAERVSV